MSVSDGRNVQTVAARGLLVMFQLPFPVPEPHQWILLYDGDCDLCTASVQRLQAWRLLRHVLVAPVQQVIWLDSAESLVWQAQSRAEILLFDAHAKQGRSGFRAIRHLLRQSAPWRGVAWMLGLPWVSWLGERVYQMVAFNRRRLSPTQWRRMTCACDPPPCVWAGWSLFGLCLGVVVAGLWWPWRVGMGHSVDALLLRFADGFRVLQWGVSLAWGLLAGLGSLYWVVRGLRDRVRPWLEQAGLSLAAGSIWLLLWRGLDAVLGGMVLGLSSDWASAIRVMLGCLACLLAIGGMSMQFYQRLARLGFIRRLAGL